VILPGLSAAWFARRRTGGRYGCKGGQGRARPRSVRCHGKRADQQANKRKGSPFIVPQRARPFPAHYCAGRGIRAPRILDQAPRPGQLADILFLSTRSWGRWTRRSFGPPNIDVSAVSSALHDTGNHHVRPRPICLSPSCVRSVNNGHSRRSSYRVASVDLANMTHVRPPKNRA
jgi:hypothetical protein